MNKKVLMSTIVLLALSMMAISQIGAGRPRRREIDPIVSTDWLAEAMVDTEIENLVILDVRTSGYEEGHIPNAISSPSFYWFINPPGPDGWPWIELPDKDDLFSTIGSAGIESDSLVVVVGGVSGQPVPPLFALADATRVAVTLLYAGVRNVAILDGGYDKWIAEDRDVSEVPVTPTPVTYTGKVDKAMFVSKEYVAKRIGKSIIVDARDPDVYFGVTLEPWTVRAGHIPTATCLPTPWLWNWIWTGEGTYKDIEVLRAMASGLVGKHQFKEIITYCGVGGYASTSYFVLSEVLGYKNVKIYDGSAQEWTADPEAPVVKLWWE